MRPQIVSREYVIAALGRSGSICPSRYVAMLEQTPADMLIENLLPWAFLPNPKGSASYCSEAVGFPILPFALAVGQDMVACFIPNRGSEPSIIVLDPWSSDKANVVEARLPNFDAWLEYAGDISRQVTASESGAA